MRRHSGMHDLPRAVIKHEEHVQGSEPDGLHRQEIASPDFLRLLGEKSPPPGGRLTVPRPAHVLGDCSGTNLKAKPSQFRLDPPLAPQRILTGHSANQGAQLW